MTIIHQITLLILLLTGMFSTGSVLAQIGIGTNTPDASSGLDLDFTDKGFLPPRMTTAQRNAIVNPANGLIIFNISTGCPDIFFTNSWYALCGVISPSGTIDHLECINATITGTLTDGVAASDVSASVPYTGGNGQYHGGQTIVSTGVSGLTATLGPGVFNNGNGNLTYTITGTPASSGMATFALSIGGQSCNLTVTVFLCPSSVTFNYDGTTVTYGVVPSANNKCWLDRNLGAAQVATSSTDAASYGHLFQWGRLADGHQVRTSSITYTNSNSDVPGHGNFILSTYWPYDWRSPQNDNLWQGVNGINNPCPTGLRVPTSAEWEIELLSWSSNDAAGAFASSLKLPVAGYRENTVGGAPVMGEGIYGKYWSDTPGSPFSFFIYFTNSNSYIPATYRAAGMSVRCLKDD